MKAPLDDRRIDRYSRQLLLREIGSRGQQALFESRVRVRGTAREAELVATWLSGAGVGVIELADIPAPVALRERNEDVTWTDAEPASLVVGVGPLPQSKWTTTSAVVWAAATGAQVVCVRAPHPPACRLCFATLLPHEGHPPTEGAFLLASVAATAALGILVGLASAGHAEGIALSLRSPAVRTVDLGGHVHD